MKTLVLLSELECNKKLANRLKEFFKKKSFKLGYIPSSTDKKRTYFNAGKEFFTAMGVDEFFYFDIDMEYDSFLLEELHNCDGIYLSGGNTFYFLKNLQKRNMLEFIRNFVLDGKLLIGASAGSIIMSDTISVAKYIDENIVGLQNLESLGLVDFEVMPHWDSHKLNYCMQKHEQFIMLRDGDGIVVIDNQIEILRDERHE